MPKGPGKKDTDKIKFFKIDPSGDIAPAFPRDEFLKEPGEPSIKGPDGLPPEPVFTLTEDENGEKSKSIRLELPAAAEGEDSADDAKSVSADDVENPAATGDSSPAREVERLRPQVEKISKETEENDLASDKADILKKYITLKEAEVRDLRDQERQYQTYLKTLTGQVEQLTSRNRELLNELEVTKRKEEVLRVENTAMKDRHHKELALTKNDYEEKLRKSGNYEAQMTDLVKSREEWKQKVREDLRKIKLKERELENKYELLKRDTQALLDSKDKHVLELKKKNDALELELESLEERLRKGHTILGSIDSKKRRLIETLKLATSLLEAIDAVENDTNSNKDRKAG